jgi:gamma-glutamylcyclotransferase (GGCT)/AIG2-like uncharacterized protein YtfP
MLNLFSYGTLQKKEVQMETFGRMLIGQKDILVGYTIEMVEITDKEVLKKSGKKFHPIIVLTNNPNDKVEGVLFEVTEEELEKADKYEVDDYKRIETIFQSGQKGLIYIKK